MELRGGLATIAAGWIGYRLGGLWNNPGKGRTKKRQGTSKGHLPTSGSTKEGVQDMEQNPVSLFDRAQWRILGAIVERPHLRAIAAAKLADLAADLDGDLSSGHGAHGLEVSMKHDEHGRGGPDPRKGRGQPTVEPSLPLPKTDGNISPRRRRTVEWEDKLAAEVGFLGGSEGGGIVEGGGAGGLGGGTWGEVEEKRPPPVSVRSGNGLAPTPTSRSRLGTPSGSLGPLDGLRTPSYGFSQQASQHEDVIDRLKEGFIQFKDGVFLKEKDRFSSLAEKQSPKVMVVGCSDSRVSPSMVMELAPGEVFTLRNIANLVPPCESKGLYHGTSAALEYAVEHLEVEHIIVLGHSSCGGIKALMSQTQDSSRTSSFIDAWMAIAWPAKEKILKEHGDLPLEDKCRLTEKESINVSLTNLLTFPFIKKRVTDRKLQVHGWYYDFIEGSMTSWTMQVSLANFEHLE